jgi:hypothetical protein
MLQCYVLMCGLSVTAFLAPPRSQRPGQGPCIYVNSCFVFLCSSSIRSGSLWYTFYQGWRHARIISLYSYRFLPQGSTKLLTKPCNVVTQRLRRSNGNLLLQLTIRRACTDTFSNTLVISQRSLFSGSQTLAFTWFVCPSYLVNVLMHANSCKFVVLYVKATHCPRLGNKIQIMNSSRMLAWIRISVKTCSEINSWNASSGTIG